MYGSIIIWMGVFCFNFRTTITGSVEVEHVSVPVKMHRALLSVQDDVVTDRHDGVQESRAVGPHLPDELLTMTAMEKVKSLHKTNKRTKKKVLKPAHTINSTNTARYFYTSWTVQYIISDEYCTCTVKQ